MWVVFIRSQRLVTQTITATSPGTMSSHWWQVQQHLATSSNGDGQHSNQLMNSKSKQLHCVAAREQQQQSCDVLFAPLVVWQRAQSLSHFFAIGVFKQIPTCVKMQIKCKWLINSPSSWSCPVADWQLHSFSSSSRVFWTVFSESSQANHRLCRKQKGVVASSWTPVHQCWVF